MIKGRLLNTDVMLLYIKKIIFQLLFLLIKLNFFLMVYTQFLQYMLINLFNIEPKKKKERK